MSTGVQTLDVDLQTTFLRESLETSITAKRLLARVDFHVAIELGFFGKGLHALRAAEGTLSRMDTLVSRQVTFFGKTLLTDGTLERPRTGTTGFKAVALESLRSAFGAMTRILVAIFVVIPVDVGEDSILDQLEFGNFRTRLRLLLLVARRIGFVL